MRRFLSAWWRTGLAALLVLQGSVGYLLHWAGRIESPDGLMPVVAIAATYLLGKDALDRFRRAAGAPAPTEPTAIEEDPTA